MKSEEDPTPQHITTFKILAIIIMKVFAKRRVSVELGNTLIACRDVIY